MFHSPSKSQSHSTKAVVGCSQSATMITRICAASTKMAKRRGAGPRRENSSRTASGQRQAYRTNIRTRIKASAGITISPPGIRSSLDDQAAERHARVVKRFAIRRLRRQPLFVALAIKPGEELVFAGRRGRLTAESAKSRYSPSLCTTISSAGGRQGAADHRPAIRRFLRSRYAGIERSRHRRQPPRSRRMGWAASCRLWRAWAGRAPPG